MPRIINTNDQPIAFCRYCMPSQGRAKAMGLEDWTDGKTDTLCYEYAAPHPTYTGEERCLLCDTVLTEEDS